MHQKWSKVNQDDHLACWQTLYLFNESMYKTFSIFQLTILQLRLTPQRRPSQRVTSTSSRSIHQPRKWKNNLQSMTSPAEAFAFNFVVVIVISCHTFFYYLSDSYISLSAFQMIIFIERKPCPTMVRYNYQTTNEKQAKYNLSMEISQRIIKSNSRR